MAISHDPNQPAEEDDVLITGELAHRSCRTPDYAAENRALAALAQELATNPGGVLQRCAELVTELCRADSAGISLLEPGSESGLFRWHGAAGGLAPHLGRLMEQDVSPYGTAIARDGVLLFREADQLFPDLKGAEPRICENLLVPWYVNGQAVGTLCAIKHTPEGRFDAEDARLLQSLARFAAAAYQMIDALDKAKVRQEELEQRVEERTRALANAHESLRTSEARFRTALEIETVGVIFLDMEGEGQIIEANDAFLAMGGYSREDLEAGRLTWQGLTPPEWMEASERAVAELMATGRTTPYEKEYIRKDSSRWRALFAAKRLPDGTVFEFVLDITARQQAEEALRKSERRAKLLLAELQHRVRNTLSVIRSIVRRTAQTSTSVEDYAMHLEGRINAFARVQTAVARDPGVGLDLTQLIADELLACVAHEGEQVRIVGPSVRLQPKAAETFGLAVHELATNAVKHGALLVPHGRIRVTWRVQDGGEAPRLVFEWKESGARERAATRKRRGFGTDLLERTLAYELKARTVQAFEPDGLRCTIELPLTERIVIGDRTSSPQQE